MVLKNILIVIAASAVLIALVVIGILAFNNLNAKPTPTPQATSSSNEEPASSARINWFPR
ncbi:MAG: hypothetical protein A2Y57_03555 [Candidatus Woykebacteria bacterium RBG_13_40_7b]|uniref:Uncharacterized protein n=1 Tax=Candidatus Woykebacteria bacterium RBG_13_40_7b TaxID=1802594 RepID=A0A1G1W824_9BACT|nr:MAG: hypothetical protein A2Y57_03555 [Candidatus Woykebacteria bacterium RBG_13_40_7b]